MGVGHCYRSQYGSIRKCKQERSVPRIVLLPGCRARQFLYVLSDVLRPEDLPNLGLTLPSRPVFLVKFHEAYRSFDRILLRLQLKLCIAADNLLCLGERPVVHLDLPAGKPDAGALRGGCKSTTPANGSGFDRLFA